MSFMILYNISKVIIIWHINLTFRFVYFHYKQTFGTHSFLAVIALATICFAGTIPNRPAFPVQTNQIQPQSGGKSAGRRVMNPAFQNAGRAPGLEIWRIEVSIMIINRCIAGC